MGIEHARRSGGGTRSSRGIIVVLVVRRPEAKARHERKDDRRPPWHVIVTRNDRHVFIEGMQPHENAVQFVALLGPRRSAGYNTHQHHSGHLLCTSDRYFDPRQPIITHRLRPTRVLMYRPLVPLIHPPANFFVYINYIIWPKIWVLSKLVFF